MGVCRNSIRTIEMTTNPTAATADTRTAAPTEARTANRANGSHRQARSHPQGKPRFDADTLAALRARLPDYLQACGLELRRQGNRLVTHCPVHDDRSPSFAVFGQRHETCGCHPCAFTGDVFAAAQWMGRAGSFPEAVKQVAAALGAYLPDGTASPATAATRAAKPMPRPKPEPPELSEAERETIHLARLAFSDAYHGGETIISEIAASLGLQLETLRWAAHGESGLALACPVGSREPWLCYAYPHGLKWRNPHPKSTPRFRWIVGNARAPWRWEWAAKPEVETVFLTEGESDALALIEAGLERDGTAACVASPGTSFPSHWAPLFKGKTAVLCFDLDGPGTQAAATIAATLKGHAAEVLRWKGARPQ
jgi:hypothetical protein